MERTARGDRDAFAAVYEKHQGTIFRFARFMTGCDAAAEDVVQEVFLVLMRAPARYDPAQASLTTYLYGIARRQTRRRLLRERRFVALDNGGSRHEPRAGGDVAGDLARRGDMQTLRRAILALPSRYREVVVLCELQDVSYVDAAATIGCPVGTVRSRLHRAKRLLLDRVTRMRNGDGGTSTKPAVASSSHLRCAV
jgi:RNA polymerase sigma-70 factor (ECF subfamily)